MTSTKSRKRLKILLPLPVVAIGIAMTLSLVFTRPQASTNAITNEGLLVETRRVERTNRVIAVNAQGTVTPARQIALSAQVGGRVVWQSEDLIPGGRFSQGTALLRVDGRDYQLAVSARAAEVDRARLNLEMEEGRRTVAEREWQQFGTAEAGGDPAELLARRGPHVRTAQQSLRAAQSGARRARLDLGRTTLRAPFNAMVVTEQVDVGQLVGPGSPLAALVGTDHFWVQVAIPVHQLTSIQMPNQAGDGGSTVRIRQTSGQVRIERTGRVIRLLPDLDPQGRMARLLIEVEDPLELNLPEEERNTIPLLLGSYVEVSIEGQTLTDVIEIPSAAIRNGNQVYVMTPENQLAIHTVDIAWRTQDTAIVQEGLSEGDQIIVSRVSAPIEGMPLRSPAAASPAATAPAPSADHGEAANGGAATP